MAKQQRRCGRRNEAGVSMITVLIALTALVVAGALAVDVGLALAGRTQAQNAADGAALAAVLNMVDPSGPTMQLGTGTTAAQATAAQNFTAANASVNIEAADVVYGNWDPTTETFDPTVDQSDPNLVTAAEVTCRLDDNANSSLPTTLARVVGRDEFQVTARAIAYRGFVGSFPPGTPELPIAIDECAITTGGGGGGGGGCAPLDCEDFASEDPPNACDLESPEDEGATTVTCLEFHSTPEQNACWTAYDSDSPSVSTPDLKDVVSDGGPGASVTDPVYVDNGDKTPVIRDIHDKFKGEGAYVGEAAGTDRYAPIHDPEQPDSWVVSLPVIECQTDDHCAGGDPVRIVGIACFELREVLVTPEKVIKGRFLCKDDPLYAECDIEGSHGGGCNFGQLADLPVLVR